MKGCGAEPGAAKANGCGSQSRASALRGFRRISGDEGFGVGVDEVPVEHILNGEFVALLLYGPRHEIGEDEDVLRVTGQVGVGE